VSLKTTELEQESTALLGKRNEESASGPRGVAALSGAREPAALSPVGPSPDSIASSGNFGEVLRHELNNPLTGILGNAELLLMELRRHHVELPTLAQQRLETIASLAVRMRERVRHLSDRWESESAQVRREPEAVALPSRFH